MKRLENILWFRIYINYIHHKNTKISFIDNFQFNTQITDYEDWKELFIDFYRHNRNNKIPYLPEPIHTEEDDEIEEETEIQQKTEENIEKQENDDNLDIKSRNCYNMVISETIKVQVLFLGDIKGKMEHLFYHLKFTQHWVGIYYLRTFGESLNLNISNPPLKMLLNCWRLHETSIEFTDNFLYESHIFYDQKKLDDENEEKIGRSIITSLSKSDMKKVLQKLLNPNDFDENTDELNSFEDTFQAFNNLRVLLQRDDLSKFPFLLFLHGECNITYVLCFFDFFFLVDFNYFCFFLGFLVLNLRKWFGF